MKSILIILIILIGCSENKEEETPLIISSDSLTQTEDSLTKNTLPQILQGAKYSQEEKTIVTGNVSPADLLQYAQTLIGTPYKYGSVDPKEGFDCSGFITHVFNHFGINVPRSSIDFTDVKREIDVAEAKAGDIVLFTGTDSTIRDVGHMGIVTSNDSSVINFIHSTSGKADGVTITPMNKYYMGRFVKVIRIFKQNDL